MGQLSQHGLDAASAYRRIKAGRWKRLLPGVLVTVSGTPTRRQWMIAAHLWGGPASVIDGADACRWYGLGVNGRTDRVDIVVPAESPCRTNDAVRVRRATAEIVVGDRGHVPYVDVSTAVIVASRGMRGQRAAIALLSRGLQTGLMTTADLRDARDRIGHKWCRGVDAALVTVGVGIRSPAEKDARDLILTSRLLPEPRWNQWLDLGDGGYPVCVDCLWDEAGMVHEVNGKRYHAWADQFDDMHARHKRLTAVGLVAVGSSPTEIRASGPATLASLERTYALNCGRGLPPGVTMVRAPANRG